MQVQIAPARRQNDHWAPPNRVALKTLDRNVASAVAKYLENPVVTLNKLLDLTK
jgi:hypothetical protein